MALSNPRTIFGIHGFTARNRTDGTFYGKSRVLGGSNLSISGETIDLFGGSSPYNWASENGTITAEISLTLKEIPNWAMEIFLGKAPTVNAAELTGDVSTLTNKLGTSTVDATTGIASIAAISGSEANLKFGKYTVEVLGTDTISIACSSNVDFARGTDAVYVDDSLVTTATVTIPSSGATVDVADFGLEFTGGSGTIALGTIGNTATFEVRPINSGSTTGSFGSTASVYPSFEAILVAQQQGSGRMFEITAYNCKAIGLPIGFTANEFSETEITIKVSYDSAKNDVMDFREIEIE